MSRVRTLSKLVVVLVAVLMVGVALASNMAFKFNAIVQNPVSRTGTGTGTTAGSSCTVCGNWISLPFVTQFDTQRLRSICLTNADFAFVAQPGVASGFGDGTTIDKTRIDALASHSCTALVTLVANPPYQPDAPIRAILKSTTSGDKNWIVVGSDSPGRQVQIRNSTSRSGSATCTVCGNWAQLPYHTTARRLRDVCLENTNFAFVAQPGEVCSGFGDATSCNPNVTDAVQSHSCTALVTLVANPAVIVGRPIRAILKSTVSGDILWSPAHF